MSASLNAGFAFLAVELSPIERALATMSLRDLLARLREDETKTIPPPKGASK